MENKYIFYKLTSKDRIAKIPLVQGYSIKIHYPFISKLNLHSPFKLIYLFWYFLTFGKYCIYYVFDENERIVHFSHVMPKIFKYAFMPRKNSTHIGPCWTNEQHRGKKIYPAVLSIICCDFIHKNKYIFTDKENIASQKGIEIVGFERFASGYKKRLLGIYSIKND